LETGRFVGFIMKYTERLKKCHHFEFELLPSKTFDGSAN
jgi:hypothetical protein